MATRMAVLGRRSGGGIVIGWALRRGEGLQAVALVAALVWMLTSTLHAASAPAPRASRSFQEEPQGETLARILEERLGSIVVTTWGPDPFGLLDVKVWIRFATSQTDPGIQVEVPVGALSKAPWTDSCVVPWEDLSARAGGGPEKDLLRGVTVIGDLRRFAAVEAGFRGSGQPPELPEYVLMTLNDHSDLHWFSGPLGEVEENEAGWTVPYRDEDAGGARMALWAQVLAEAQGRERASRLDGVLQEPLRKLRLSFEGADLFEQGDGWLRLELARTLDSPRVVTQVPASSMTPGRWYGEYVMDWEAVVFHAEGEGGRSRLAGTLRVRDLVPVAFVEASVVLSDPAIRALSYVVLSFNDRPDLAWLSAAPAERTRVPEGWATRFRDPDAGQNRIRLWREVMEDTDPDIEECLGVFAQILEEPLRSLQVVMEGAGPFLGEGGVLRMALSESGDEEGVMVDIPISAARSFGQHAWVCGIDWEEVVGGAVVPAEGERLERVRSVGGLMRFARVGASLETPSGQAAFPRWLVISMNGYTGLPWFSGGAGAQYERGGRWVTEYSDGEAGRSRMRAWGAFLQTPSWEPSVGLRSILEEPLRELGLTVHGVTPFEEGEAWVRLEIALFAGARWAASEIPGSVLRADGWHGEYRLGWEEVARYAVDEQSRSYFSRIENVGGFRAVGEIVASVVQGGRGACASQRLVLTANEHWGLPLLSSPAGAGEDREGKWVTPYVDENGGERRMRQWERLLAEGEPRRWEPSGGLQAILEEPLRVLGLATGDLWTGKAVITLRMAADRCGPWVAATIPATALKPGGAPGQYIVPLEEVIRCVTEGRGRGRLRSMMSVGELSAFGVIDVSVETPGDRSDNPGWMTITVNDHPGLPLFHAQGVGTPSGNGRWKVSYQDPDAGRGRMRLWEIPLAEQTRNACSGGPRPPPTVWLAPFALFLLGCGLIAERFISRFETFHLLLARCVVASFFIFALSRAFDPHVPYRLETEVCSVGLILVLAMIPAAILTAATAMRRKASDGRQHQPPGTRGRVIMLGLLGACIGLAVANRLFFPWALPYLHTALSVAAITLGQIALQRGGLAASPAGRAAAVGVGTSVVLLLFLWRPDVPHLERLVKRPLDKAHYQVLARMFDPDFNGYSLVLGSDLFLSVQGARFRPVREVPGNYIDENGLGGDLREPVRARENLADSHVRAPLPGVQGVVWVSLGSLRSEVVLDKELSLWAPHLHALVRSGVVFPRHHAVSSVSETSIAAELMGDVDWEGWDDRTVDQVPLARLRRANWFVFAAGSFLLPESLYVKGLDDWHYFEPDPDSSEGPASLWPRLEHYGRLLGEDGRPFLLFLHFADTSRDRRRGSGGVNPAGDPRKVYWHTLSRLDACLGRLMALLESDGLGERTVIIVNSDRGESFREHGSCIHSGALYEEWINAPLVFRIPGVDGGTVVENVVSALDILPTLLDLLGEEPTGNLVGRSLAPALRGGSVEGDAAFGVAIQPFLSGAMFRADLQIDKVYAICDGEKILLDRQGGGVECYDLREDPGETENLWGSDTSRDRRLSALLDRWLYGVGFPEEIPSAPNRRGREGVHPPLQVLP